MVVVVVVVYREVIRWWEWWWVLMNVVVTVMVYMGMCVSLYASVRACVCDSVLKCMHANFVC